MTTTTKSLRGTKYWSALGSFLAIQFLGLNYLITGKFIEFDLKSYMGSGGMFLFLLAAINLLPADVKHVLVFWRFSDPLPGCRAFSEIARTDPRIDLEVLKQKLGKLPRNPREQNSLWYRLFKTIAKNPAIFIQHSHFLTLRDVSALLVLLLLASTCVTLALRGVGAAMFAAGIELVLFLLFATAARNAGKRFVASVLSEYCSNQKS